MAVITVNGEKQTIEQPVTVTELITLNNIAQPDMVSVQLNEEFVNREDYATLAVYDGDEIDFLYFMGGGSR
jgi:sulfur carrier protein